jgi:glucose 1-dehydrogenase
MELAGKTALITGAATRIGRSIALALASEGAVIVLHYRHSREEAEQTLKEIHRVSPLSFAVQGDLSDREQIEAVAEKACEQRQIDILVNNASLFPVEDRFFTFDMVHWDRLWNVNVIAPMILSRRLFADHHCGAIVNLIDASLNRISFENFVYRMTKAALKEMTLMLALELAPHVRVNGIGPGAILPPAKMGPDGKTIRPDENQAAASFEAYVQKHVPLKRSGSPEIIAANVLHLLKQDFLTGVILPVDGGEYI